MLDTLAVSLSSKHVHGDMFAGEWHSKRIEHRGQVLMYRHRPTLILGGGQKKKEIYYQEALPLLSALLDESVAMTKKRLS